MKLLKRMERDPCEAEYQDALESLRRKQYYRAAESLRRLSDSHLKARTYYAWLMERGLGCRRDENQANLLYLSAAEDGAAIAQYFLGCMYWRRRKGMECIKWFEQAAAHGFVAADYCLNRVYRAGTIVARDEEKAKYHLDRAAARGHLYALRDVQYYALLGGYGLSAQLFAPFRFVSILFEIAQTLLHSPDDLRLNRYYEVRNLKQTGKSGSE